MKMPTLFNPINTEPDHNNYSFFGKSWKDRANGVTQLSSKVGKEQDQGAEPAPSFDPNVTKTVSISNTTTEPNSKRDAHQVNLLNARLNEYLDAEHTPTYSKKESLRLFDTPLMHFNVPSVRDVRIGSMKSFNEAKSLNRLKDAFVKSSPQAREAFLETIKDDSNKNLIAKLIHEDPLTQLHRKKSALEQPANTKVETIKEFFKVRAVELRRVNRKIAEIEQPSSYERHLASGHGLKVSDRSLVVEELKNRAKNHANLGGAFAYDNYLESKQEVRKFTAEKFHALGEAIKKYQADQSDQNKTALLNVVRPILHSKDRHAVHRFVRDMTNQLKKAGADQDLLKDLKELTPESPGIGLQALQTFVPGTGKGMRLADKAMRMEQGFMQTLDLSRKHADQLKHNLMHYNFDGVNQLKAYLNNGLLDQRLKGQSLIFLQSTQGKSFVKAVVADAKTNPALLEAATELEKLTKEFAFTRKQRQENTNKILSALKDVIPFTNDVEIKMDKLIQQNQHIFMRTSDVDFWQRESVGKIGTRISTPEISDRKAQHQHSRIFKQGIMRSAAINLSTDLAQFMSQGINNTLQNRNMAVEGSKLGGVIGSTIGNLVSTPISTAALGTPYAFVAFPGILDSVLIPIFWSIGLAPGAAIGGSIMGHMKKNRLKETQDTRDNVNLDINALQRAGNKTTYTSASKKIDVADSLQQLKLVKKDLPKLATQPVHLSIKDQFSATHGKLWKELGKEAGKSLVDTVKYVGYTGPNNFITDIVVNGEWEWGWNKTKNAHTPGKTTFELPKIDSELWSIEKELLNAFDEKLKSLKNSS